MQVIDKFYDYVKALTGDYAGCDRAKLTKNEMERLLISNIIGAANVGVSEFCASFPGTTTDWIEVARQFRDQGFKFRAEMEKRDGINRVVVQMSW